jgi:nitrogen-specific signal transduction histidine kinase
LEISGYDNKKIGATTIVVVLIVALLVDTFFLKIYDLYSKDPTSALRISVFIIISSIYCVGQYIILKSIKPESKEHSLSRRLHRIGAFHNIVTLVQYVLTALLVYVILQILLTSQYTTMILPLATSISCILGCCMLAVLAERFFSWFRNSRDYTVLLYALSATILAVTTVVLFVFVDTVVSSTKPDTIMPKVGGTGLFIAPGTANGLLDSAYIISSILSFILTWLATTMLLRYHSKKIGRVKYSILAGLPLIYFTTQFLSLFFNLFTPLLNSDPVFYGILLTIIFTFSKLVGGIFFGIAFWMAARRINRDNVVRKYLIISAYGLILLFISIQINGIIVTSYPPFGLITTMFIGLSCYMVLVGIYSSAVSISQDVKLRKLIRKSAIEESKLLISIGSAQIEQEIERRTINVAKEQQDTLIQQTGIQSSLTEHDMKQYVSEVLEEIHVLQNIDDILKKGKEILETSTEFLACSKVGGIRLVYNNYFISYEKVMQEYSKGVHKGIRLVTSIDGNSLDIVRKFLSIGVQIRHVKNMPPIDFAVSDKEMIATVEKIESGQAIKSLLVSSEKPYIDHFTSIFDELWKGGVNADVRIKAIEDGIDTEGIEIIQNPTEIQMTTFNLLKSAEEEILVIFSSANAFHRQEYLGATQILKDAANERGVKVRILTPADDLIVETTQRWMEQQEKQEQQSSNQQKINTRFIEPYLQTKVSLLIVDRKFSLSVELKDDTAQKSNEAMGLATYSNSKPTVFSYVSIFENLWLQNELYHQVKEANEQLELANEKLKVHDKLQKEFIDVAAHELKTPIQPIISLSEVVLSHTKDKEQAKLLEVINRNAKRLSRLTEDILDVTRIESQSLRLRKERLNLIEMINSAIADTRNQIKKEYKDNMKLESIFNGNIFIEADRNRIYQVILNLLNNAIKFTDEGTIVISATAEEKNGRSDVVVSVKDTGQGIDYEILPRLFTKFATKSEKGGTGLGLFISKSIVEAHGGKIWAENNKEEKGATFSFSLPIVNK